MCKSEPGNSQNEQMSGQETKCYPVDMNSEPHDTIIQPQLSGQETGCHLVDMKSEPVNQPHEINCRYDIYPENIKTEPDLPIYILVNVKTEATDRMITQDTTTSQTEDATTSSNAVTVKSEPDESSSRSEYVKIETDGRWPQLESNQSNAYMYSLDNHKEHSTNGPGQSKDTSFGKLYKCTNCDMVFGMMADLTIHMMTHAVTCSVCGLVCLTSGFLVAQMTCHRTYKCDVCGKTFTHQYKLKLHLKNHTREKPYRCNVCVKKFTHQSYLNIHMRIHSGEKPYKCDVCSKRFTKYSGLVSHVRTHTGEKPYKCEVCDKRFSQNGSLTTHLRTHTGEKPYKCDVCDKRFTQPGTRTQHMRTHPNTLQM